MVASVSPITTLSSREFAHDLARAKRVARKGPVIITDRGRPTFALMAIEDYRRLTGEGLGDRSLLDVMDSLPDTSGIDFEPPHLKGRIRDAELD